MAWGCGRCACRGASSNSRGNVQVSLVLRDVECIDLSKAGLLGGIVGRMGVIDTSAAPGSYTVTAWGLPITPNLASPAQRAGTVAPY